MHLGLHLLAFRYVTDCVLRFTNDPIGLKLTVCLNGLMRINLIRVQMYPYRIDTSITKKDFL